MLGNHGGIVPSLDREHFPMSSKSKAGTFPTTRWSLVLQVNEGAQEESRVALEELCQRYWYPLYAYVRLRGFREAEDLTQGYFERLLAQEVFARADVDRGRLRTFLLTDLKHFLADETRRATALKRGGGHEIVSIEGLEAEERFEKEGGLGGDPEKVYQRAWAETLIKGIVEGIEAEYRKSGKAETFALIREHLYGKEAELSYEDMAVRLGCSVSAARLTVFRMRQRFRGLLESEIAHTVASSEDVNDEIDFLFQAVG